MKHETCRVTVVLADTWLELDELCRMTGVTELWLVQRMEEGLLAPASRRPGESPRFNADALRRVRRMASLERDFDAAPELASLVVELEHQLAVMRERLRRSGG